MLVLRGRPDFFMIVEYYIHHITINFHFDDDAMEKKHDLSSSDAHERSNHCTEPFRSMIFGQVMANIRHGGGSRTVVFWTFTEVVRCWLFFLDGGGCPHGKKGSYF